MNPAWETSPKQSDPGHTKPIPLKKEKNRKNSISRIHKSSKESQKVWPSGYSLPPRDCKNTDPQHSDLGKNCETWKWKHTGAWEQRKQAQHQEEEESFHLPWTSCKETPSLACPSQSPFSSQVLPLFQHRPSTSLGSGFGLLYHVLKPVLFFWPQPLEVLVFRLGFHLSSISLNLARYPFCVRAPR